MSRLACDHYSTGRSVPITREARQGAVGLHEMHVVVPDGVTLIFVEVPPEQPLRRDTRGD